MYSKSAIPLIGLYWFRLAKLECEAAAIDPIFPAKNFQQLYAKSIWNIGKKFCDFNLLNVCVLDQLRNILQNSVTDLTLSFHPDFSNGK
jgi:hypothetical protein